jgi:serine/threonine protein kinase
VSPGNILLGRNGAVKLTDMGLCKALEAERSHGFVGTPPYACPEALRGGKHTERFDLFSLATVLYELLTGEPPFGTGEPDTIFRTMMDPEAELTVPEDVPSDLSTLVTTLLTVEGRQTKLQSATECLAFLHTLGEKIADDAQMGVVVAQIAARTQAATENKHTTIPVLFPPRPRRMLRWALAGGAAALMMILGLNAYLLTSSTAPADAVATRPAQEPSTEPYMVFVPDNTPTAVCESPSIVADETTHVADVTERVALETKSEPVERGATKQARSTRGAQTELLPAKSRGSYVWRSN